MKKTSLYDVHVELGARMVEFGGFMMPVQYTTINEEHQAVREAAGLFDVSHMGEFIARGEDAEAFLNSITSNDLSKLKKGRAQYTCLLNERGGVVDDLIIYKMADKAEGDPEDSFMLVVNAGNADKDWEWVNSHKKGNLTLENISDDMALFALQGPKSSEILKELTDVDVEGVKFYHYTIGTVAGIDDVIISGTGYTGSGGYELYLNKDGAEKLWFALMEAGKKHGMLPAGLGARDTLRLEMGYCLYGHELSEDINPLEAGLGWITKLSKDDFIGKDKVAAIKEAGVSRKLIAFTLEGRRVPRQGYPIVAEDGSEVGEVTSGTQSPSLDIPIGMAYVDVNRVSEPLGVQIRKKVFPLEQVKLPFYKV